MQLKVKSWLDVVAIGVTGLVIVSVVSAALSFVGRFLAHGLLVGTVALALFAIVVTWAFRRTSQMLSKDKAVTS